MKRKNDATNKRVVGLVSRWFCLDPPAGGFRYGLFVFGWDRSDPAAHARHYAYCQYGKIIYLTQK